MADEDTVAKQSHLVKIIQVYLYSSILKVIVLTLFQHIKMSEIFQIRFLN